MSKKLSVLILAAGKGTRMNNPNIPKVLAELNGKPLIAYVLETSSKIQPESVNVIVGYHKEQVVEYINSLDYTNIQYVEQNEQLGTGHAVVQAKHLYEGIDSGVLILSGDVPLLTADSLTRFIEQHNANDATLSVLSAETENPTGYGRIVRDDNGEFVRIVEEKDASDAIKAIKEINSGIYYVNSDILFESLDKVRNTNAQAEYYLTDIVEIIKTSNMKVSATLSATFEEIQGINTTEQLEKLAGKL